MALRLGTPLTSFAPCGAIQCVVHNFFIYCALFGNTALVIVQPRLVTRRQPIPPRLYVSVTVSAGLRESAYGIMPLLLLTFQLGAQQAISLLADLFDFLEV